MRFHHSNIINEKAAAISAGNSKIKGSLNIFRYDNSDKS
jgi:hypothetical protein